MYLQHGLDDSDYLGHFSRPHGSTDQTNNICIRRHVIFSNIAVINFQLTALLKELIK